MCASGVGPIRTITRRECAGRRVPVAQTRIDRILEQYQAWLVDGAAFLLRLLGFYLLARLLIVPSIVRVVEARNRNNPTLVNAIRLYLRIVIVVLGVPIAIAAAGFGGVAAGSGVVLAAATLAFGVAGRDVIGNLVSGLFLVVDPEFNVGDYIEWDDDAGRVKRIDLRVTRVQTNEGEAVIVPNTQLTTETVTRPFASEHHRVTETLTVAYADDTERVRELLADAATGTSGVATEPAPAVHVTALTTDAVEMTVWLWIRNDSTTRHARVRTAFRTAVKDRLLEADVSLAPATQRELSGTVAIEDEADRG